MLFDPPQAFGLVLDISDRKDRDGKRLSTKVRSQLVEFASRLEGEDVLYLCQLNPDQPATAEGSRTALMGNWEAEQESLDLGYLLEYTLASLAQEDSDITRTLCLVTDRLGRDGMNSIMNLNCLRQKSGWECRFLVMGIGNRYDRGELAAFCQGEGVDFRHTTEVENLCSVMSNWFRRDTDGE